MGNEEEQHIEYSTPEVNANNDLNRSINENLMNSKLSRNNSNQSTTEELLNFSTRKLIMRY